jgi:tRNA-specific A34 adenosine deaminase
MVVHAEVNALLIAGQRADGATIYVHGRPVCATCAGAIIQSGVERIVAEAPRRGATGNGRKAAASHGTCSERRTNTSIRIHTPASRTAGRPPRLPSKKTAAHGLTGVDPPSRGASEREPSSAVPDINAVGLIQRSRMNVAERCGEVDRNCLPASAPTVPWRIPIAFHPTAARLCWSAFQRPGCRSGRVLYPATRPRTQCPERGCPHSR